MYFKIIKKERHAESLDQLGHGIRSFRRQFFLRPYISQKKLRGNFVQISYGLSSNFLILFDSY